MNQRVNIYLRAQIADIVRQEAARLDRSVNWVIERCVERGLPSVRKLKPDTEVRAKDEVSR